MINKTGEIMRIIIIIIMMILILSDLLFLYCLAECFAFSVAHEYVQLLYFM